MRKFWYKTKLNVSTTFAFLILITPVIGRIYELKYFAFFKLRESALKTRKAKKQEVKKAKQLISSSKNKQIAVDNHDKLKDDLNM